MQSFSFDTMTMDWEPGHSLFGGGATFGGRPIVQLKTLSDRRAEGGGVAYVLRLMPPEGKVIKIIATALSDEHIFHLEGGRGTKTASRFAFLATTR
ncbi:MAG TPA: hypothetical protein VH855_11570 [Acetobacteraceae bacterium]|jgi:hypothetical protein